MRFCRQFMIIALCVSLFAGCSFFTNDIEDSTSLVFRLPDLEKHAVRAARALDAGESEEYTLNISLKGDIKQSQSVVISSGASVEFNDLIAGKKVYAEAYVVRTLAGQTEYLYTARSEQIKLQAGENTAELNMQNPYDYTIKLDANGGTFGSDSTVYEFHTASGLPSAESLDISRSGYTFAGWSKSKGVKSAAYSDEADFLPFADSTLYAVWSPKSVTVSSEEELTDAFKQDYALILLANTIFIENDLEADKDLTIDGQGKAGIKINNGTVSFKNVTFQNGAGTHSVRWNDTDKIQRFGMIMWKGCNSLTFENCTFKDNETTDDIGGGAIAMFGQGKFKVKSCTFEGNKSTHGGAIDIGTADLVFIKNCTFKGNSTDNDIYLGGSDAYVYGSGNTSDKSTPYGCYDKSKECPTLFASALDGDEDEFDTLKISHGNEETKPAIVIHLTEARDDELFFVVYFFNTDGTEITQIHTTATNCPTLRFELESIHNLEVSDGMEILISVNVYESRSAMESGATPVFTSNGQVSAILSTSTDSEVTVAISGV